MEDLSVVVFEQISRSPAVSAEESSRTKDLEDNLREMFIKSVKELCAEYRHDKKMNDSSSDILRPKLLVSIQRPDDSDVGELALALMDQRKQLGRKIKNPVTGEKVVCFDIPADYDVEGIENIEEIKDRLGKWRIQRRIRESKMNDTYYCHLASRQTFRSIPEVLNFIMHGPQDKPSPKRTATDVASTSQGDDMMASKSPSKKQRKDKGKMVDIPPGPSTVNTPFPCLELSIVPWMPIESEMNTYYYHRSLRQIQYWTAEPVSYLRCDPQPSSVIQDYEEINFVDLTQDSDVEDENEIMYSNLEVTGVAQSTVVEDEAFQGLGMLPQDSDEEGENEPYSNLEMSEVAQQAVVEDEAFQGMGVLDEFNNLFAKTTFEDPLVREINDDVVTPPAHNKEIGRDNCAENQAVITTEPVESLTVTKSSNGQSRNFQENCGPAKKIPTSLEEAVTMLDQIDIERNDQLYSGYLFRQYGCYFNEPHPVNHSSIDDYDLIIGPLFGDL